MKASLGDFKGNDASNYAGDDSCKGFGYFCPKNLSEAKF